ncbi:MAG: UDP-glucose dehydrogenase family protein [Helicobacteraceae bacterium]
MNVAMIGTGYVGLVSGTCFAQMGNKVFCVDVVSEKIENLKNGVIPIYEPGLKEMVEENYAKGNLDFTLDLSLALENADVAFIAVGTPQGEDGSADLSYVLNVAKKIGQTVQKNLVVVDKSTVPVGTADLVAKTIASEQAARGSNHEIFVVSNPEFLKEGAAINDFLKPDRIVVGADNAKALELMKSLYAPFTHNHDNFIAMDIKSAELTKYAANAMLATKISFMNEISQICEIVGADINQIRIGIGSDKRIGYNFIYPGCGYGGSCFPKDVQALVKTAKNFGYDAKLIAAVEEVNKNQKKLLVKKIVSFFGEDLSALSFGVWGLSFKPETDDMREAPSITIIKELLARGAKVKAYDPKAADEAKKFYLKGADVFYARDKYEAISGCDALVLITEWREFRTPDLQEIARHLKQKIIFDGRNQYNAQDLSKAGFKYFQIGVKND